jgi:hypothetical protein
MATVAKYATLADLVSRLDGDGKIAPISEILNQDLPILKDLGFVECNKTDGYLHTIRTGLPAPTWRKLYGGVQPSKSTTAQVTDTCGNLESYSEVDKDLADINGNTAAWRFSEEAPFIEAMGQEVAKTIFYGDTDKNPERFMGIAARYNTTDVKKAASARNVVNFGGSGTNLTSIYFISHAVFHGIYPKGSKVGLSKSDRGQVTITKSDGSMYEAYRTHYKWQVGTTLDDWRGCARICNVPLDTLATTKEKREELIQKLITAKNLIESKYQARCKIYVPREIMSILEVAAVEMSHNALSIREAAGQLVANFFGMPIEICDAISTAESAVK